MNARERRLLQDLRDFLSHSTFPTKENEVYIDGLKVVYARERHVRDALLTRVEDKLDGTTKKQARTAVRATATDRTDRDPHGLV